MVEGHNAVRCSRARGGVGAVQNHPQRGENPELGRPLLLLVGGVFLVRMEERVVPPHAARVDVDPSLLAIIKSPGAPSKGPRPGPLPPSVPGVEGVLAAITGVFGIVRHGVAHSAAMREKHGDIYRLPFAGSQVLFVWDADEIHKILKNEDRVWSTALGWGALMSDGLDPHVDNVGTLGALDFDEHRVARKLVQPAFTLKAIEGYLRIADRHYARTVPAWLARGSVAFKREVRALLADVASEIFTGFRDPEQIARVDRALADFWRALVALSRNPLVSPTFRRARRGLATLIQTFLAVVPERRRSPGDDLFSHMCAVTDTDGLGDEAMVRVFVTIMFGAFDTTSAGMTSMAYLLAKHPEWQERLRAEARAVGTGPLDAAALKSLKEHEWAWKETLRLMPVNGFLPRRPLRQVEVGGHTLAPGTLVAPMNGGIGRHPRWWKEPTKFDPERFSPERAEDRQHPGIYNPFGAGAHACVGMQLANMEVKLFWHQVLSSCRFRLAPDYEARHSYTPMGMVSGDVRLTLERV
jgi:cytochrome P450